MTVPAEATIAGAAPASASAHGLVAALRVAQLLAVAGDQEQGVVGARAEHQDQRDAGGLPVDGHANLGQGVAGRPQQLLRRHHREDRDDPEHRAAIDQHQQHQHQHERGGEQGRVDPAEHLDGVGRVPGRAGYLYLKAVSTLGVRAGSDLIHRRGQCVGVA